MVFGENLGKNLHEILQKTHMAQVFGDSSGFFFVWISIQTWSSSRNSMGGFKRFFFMFIGHKKGGFETARHGGFYPQRIERRDVDLHLWDFVPAAIDLMRKTQRV